MFASVPRRVATAVTIRCRRSTPPNLTSPPTCKRVHQVGVRSEVSCIAPKVTDELPFEDFLGLIQFPCRKRVIEGFQCAILAEQDPQVYFSKVLHDWTTGAGTPHRVATATSHRVVDPNREVGDFDPVDVCRHDVTRVH